MPHLHDLSQVRLETCALTIGSFDGVHLGHQALIRSVVEDARQSGMSAVVLTFYPHPSVVLRGRRPAFYITTPDERAALLMRMGVDLVITQTFDTALSRVTANEFLDRLQSSLQMRSLWVGEDFALGHRRQGNVPFLEQAAARRGFRLQVEPPVLVDGEVVSSTRVRESLRAGDVARAGRYLGRPFVIPGKVIQGAGRGKRLNMPTANLEIWEERACPGSGVYACLARVQGRSWKAVTNIGVRPTFEGDGRRPVVEAHLLDFDGELYGEEMRLAFIDRLRDERRFPDPQALIEQIQRDILRARVILDSRLETFDD
ncbi:MAG: bifunctional riboflavin kinase/FAD synthetase [Chloroflexota bacterium]